MPIEDRRRSGLFRAEAIARYEAAEVESVFPQLGFRKGSRYLWLALPPVVASLLVVIRVEMPRTLHFDAVETAIACEGHAASLLFPVPPNLVQWVGEGQPIRVLDGPLFDEPLQVVRLGTLDDCSYTVEPGQLLLPDQRAGTGSLRSPSVAFVAPVPSVEAREPTGVSRRIVVVHMGTQTLGELIFRGEDPVK